MKNILYWDIYEISSAANTLHAVKMRGRLRKFAIANDFNFLTENATDLENIVRFAVPVDFDIVLIERFLKDIVPDVEIKMVSKNVPNPVLSKIKINDESRYII